jgi:cell division protein FtsB
MNINRSPKGCKTVLILSIICFTLIVLAAIGAWVYVQQQQIAQRDRELQQAKQLKEYEQSQINERQRKDCIAKSDNPVGWMTCR